MKSFEVTIAGSGKTFTVEEGETVLAAALRQGVMLPYSCKNGTCGSCKGLVEEGMVDPTDLLVGKEVAMADFYQTGVVATFHRFGSVDLERMEAELTEFNDTMSIIKSCIEKLPDGQKEVLHLRDIEGFTYKEISDITGITVERVKVNLHRARKTLRYQIQTLKS